MYEPREDSFLILKHIKNYTNQTYKVLDVGTGTGILAEEASKYAKQVTAIDIDKKSISKLMKNNTNNKIKFIVSDLFSNIKEKFDLIIFNPPYLPSKKIKDKRIDGGEQGTEIIEKFLKQAKIYLKKNGKTLLICSSLNNNVENLFDKYNYRYKKIDEKKMFFEKLFLYKLEPK